MKDIVAKVESYEKDGQTKHKYVNIGVIRESEHGEYVLIDPTVDLAGVLIKQRLMNPEKAGGSVMASIFDRDRQNSGGGQSAPKPKPGADDDFSDDIPF